MQGASLQPQKQVAAAEEDGSGGEPLLRPTAARIPKKKAVGIRSWLVLDSTGQAQVVEVGKQAIMRRTGLPGRDLRILDPLLSYPSTVLGRERAIVFSVEQIKAIITAQEVLLLNSKDPSVIPLVDELQKRILCYHQAIKEEAGDGMPVSPPDYSEEKAEGKEESVENRDGPKPLPFEFVALEACLEVACSCLDSEARTLEQEAYPALDRLTSKICTLNLERVRQIKSRLVAIIGRVQKVRDEVEQLVDDEGDMAEMYLTDKLEEQVEAEAEAEAEASSSEEDGVEEDESEILEGTESEETMFGDPSRGSHGAISKHLDVKELEMLLEAYFVQIDATLNKLSTLREYVDDTEDYINIMLDDKQNHLLQMGVMLTTTTLVVSAFVVVAGIFGMNIKIDLFDVEKGYGMTEFMWTVGGCTVGTIFLFIMAIACYKHRSLLD